MFVFVKKELLFTTFSENPDAMYNVGKCTWLNILADAEFAVICVSLFNLGGVLSPEADLRPRPSLRTHNREREKSSGQTTQFNIWTIWAMDRTLVKPQVNLRLLRSNSFEIPASDDENE